MRDNIPGFEGYHVTENGEVFSRLGHSKIWTPLKLCISKGYKRVRLRHCFINVHTLVLLAHRGEKPTPSHLCRHLDGDKTNNHVSNLAWGTSKENSDDTKRHGRRHCGEKVCFAKLNDENIKTIFEKFNQGASLIDLAKEFGVWRCNIVFILKRKIWSHVEISDELLEATRAKFKPYNPKFNKRISQEVARLIFEKVTKLGYINYSRLAKEFSFKDMAIRRLLLHPNNEDLRQKFNFHISDYKLPSRAKNNSQIGLEDKK